MSIIDTKRDIMQVLEARLLAGVLQNIDNFNMLEEKTNKNIIFTVDDYKKFYEVCKILYNKQKYTNIDEFALSTFLNTLSIDENRKKECMNIFYLIQQLNDSDLIDFEGVLEQYTIVSVPLRLYDKIARNGGLEEFIGKLTNFDNSEDLTTTIEGMISEICSVGTADSNFVETNLTQSINDDFIKNIRSGKRIDCVPFDLRYSYLNKWNKGIVRGVNGIAGWSGQGKSSILITVYVLSLLENSKDKICLFCNEQVYETFIQTITFAYITNVLVFLNQNAKTISRAEYGENCLSKEDMDYFVNAMLHWKERYKDRITHIYFETMQPSILRREIKKKVRQGFRHFVYDTFKADEEEYKDIIELSKVADNLTKRFNITFTITLQMSGESYGTKYLTYKCLARAKAIKEILENLIMFRKLDKEELVNLIVMKHNEETGKEEEVSFRMDVPYYAVFCDKNRNGRDGYVLLYYIDLDTLYYEEIGVIQNMPKDTSRKKSS